MKILFKNYLKLIILAFVIALFVTNCQKDDTTTTVQEIEQAQQGDYSINYVDGETIPDIINIISSGKKGASKESGSKTNTVNNTFGTISIASVMEVIDTLGNQNYSFVLMPKTPKPNSIFNLVVSVANGTQNLAIMEYRMAPSFAEAYHNGTKTLAEFTGSILKFPFNPDNNLFAKGDTCIQNIDEVVNCDRLDIDQGRILDAPSGGAGVYTGLLDPITYTGADGGNVDHNYGGPTTGETGERGSTFWVCTCGVEHPDPSKCECTKGDGLGAGSKGAHGIWVITIFPPDSHTNRSSTAQKGGNCCDPTAIVGAVGINPLRVERINIITLTLRLLRDSDEANWLNNNATDEQINSIHSILTENNNSEEAKEFAKSGIKLDMVLSNEYQVVNTNKLPTELDLCCPGDCCPDVSLYTNDRIVYEYGIQPVVAFIDGSFNLIIGTSELIGSDEWVGSRIRKMMLEIGIDVPTDIDNEHLSELYRIRKRDNVVIVEYRPGLLKSMLDVGLDTLDVLAFLSPAKGGGPVLFAKIGGTVSITSISKHIRDITVTSVKIDNAVNNLKSKAKYILEGTGEFKTVGGHHPLAKIAFNSDKFYDLQKAFSVSQNSLENAWKSANSGIPINLHQQITGNQNRLYSAFAKTNEILTIEKMADIEIQALIDAKIPKDIATGWVIKALEDLKTQGVKVITNIPWNGLN